MIAPLLLQTQGEFAPWTKKKKWQQSWFIVQRWLTMLEVTKCDTGQGQGFQK